MQMTNTVFSELAYKHNYIYTEEHMVANFKKNEYRLGVVVYLCNSQALRKWRQEGQEFHASLARKWKKYSGVSTETPWKAWEFYFSFLLVIGAFYIHLLTLSGNL